MGSVAHGSGTLLPIWQESRADRALYCQLGRNRARIGHFAANLAGIARGSGTLLNQAI
ncbi:MAG: hypothetical protein K6T83_16010 [Alicyclobacillus sp.]|nr:hypothetical protein [Alicyclobacillus sp.]